MQQDSAKFITIPRLAKEIGLSRSQVFRKVKAGEIPAHKIGRIFLVPKDYADSILGIMTEKDKKLIIKAVDKTIKEYGEVLKKLGKE